MDTAAALARKEYLKKYVNNPEDEKKKKKSKKRKKPQAASVGVRVVDEDPVWQKPVMIQDDEDDSEDEVQPQIEEDIEVKRMKRMEQIRARNVKSEDGSGWVVVADVRAQRNQSNPASQNADSLSGDISPPRRNRPIIPKSEPLSESEDISPPRRNRPNSQKTDDFGGDISPPRRKRAHSQETNDIGGDISPPRRSRPNSEKTDDLGGDISPPRRNRPNKTYVSSVSPPRRNRPHSPTNDGSVEDISPPRRRRAPSQTIDASVDDLSPPRKKSKDLSPPRKSSRVSHTIDLSPPRKNKSTSKDVAKTGLLTGEDIKMEIDKKRKEELTRYKELDPSVSGRGAQPIYRDKAGNRMTKEEVLKQQKGEEKPKEKELEWGTGLAQKREAEARQRELELEKERPFARGRDDPELDNMLKERVRWGDPMAHLVKSKQPELVLQDYGEDEKMKESGFIVPQKIPSHSWIVRKVDAPSNRYGIKPGRHWDGVDRSNGYEKEYFKRMNEKSATEKEAYLWSVSDM